ncbi:PhoH family protein, partial [Vibrio breoganii]
LEGSFWDGVDNVESRSLGGKTLHTLARAPFDPTFLNQYVIDEESDFAGRVKEIEAERITLRDLSRERLMNRKTWDITPKNVYQGMAIDALLDPDIDLVILTGAAG